jgi:glycosyltransferase involved in cell wall biosynthesis
MEGFGLPGLEAMKHGAPVASSNRTCLPEVFGDGAIYFNPDDTAEMTEVISRLISNKKLRNQLIKKGEKQTAHYSWARMAKQTLAIYDKILTSSAER